MLGDFNVVEEAIDRIPAASDAEGPVLALDNLRSNLNLEDGWRHTYPNKLNFTFSHNKGKSRLDRIYTKHDIILNSREWRIEDSGIKTDHLLVSAEIATKRAPDTKRGRWTIPKHLIKDRKLTDEIRKIGNRKLKEMIEMMESEMRSEAKNPQTLFAEFKKSVRKAAREREKVVVPRAQKQIENLEKDRVKIMNCRDRPQEERIEETAILEKQINQLSQNLHQKKRNNMKTSFAIEGETISKTWTRSGKEKKTRDIFRALKRKETNADGSAQYETRSKQMAEIMREHHDEMQDEGIDKSETSAQRRENIANITQHIKVQVTKQGEERLKIEGKITDEEIRFVIRNLENERAPGIDGIPYELWKRLLAIFEAESKDEKRIEQAFDVIKMLAIVYNDITKHGIVKGTEFAKGWMCPIYKKNDRTEAANYRPITLLNSDYKILTKIMSLRLADAVPQIVHKNQAGFIPGRNIYDQVKLAQTIINYAEATEINGMIVALDQEKVYDKIAHDYLWEVLDKFGIPEAFIRTLKALYSDAETQVMVNGFLSRPFIVKRGVRQGDPLSCLIFDIAIEPLAIMLRESSLIGISIPNPEEAERLIATLFADDTTTYLSEMDNFEDLQKILDEWCTASRAKFNINKTEVIPIGTKEYRTNVIKSRKTNEKSAAIPANIHIAEDGEPTRLLGGWIGNEIDNVAPWTKIIDDIDRRLGIWEMSHPTIEGRRLIILMVIGGKTQYLAMIQGMPDIVVKKLERRMSKFLWEDKRATVNLTKMKRPITEGGKDILDLVARNEAMTIMWLKSYLNLGEDRATWTYFADAIIKEHASGQITIDESMKMNVFLQSWEASNLPDPLRGMMKTAKKYGLRLEGLAFERETMREMPIWLHKEADPKIRKLNQSKESKCLRNNHRVRTVGDTEMVATMAKYPNHKERKDCKCGACKQMRKDDKCGNPNLCMKRAKSLLACIPHKWNPTMPQPEDYENLTREETEQDWVLEDGNDIIDFDARITCKGPIKNAFRIFTSGKTNNNLPDTRPIDDEEIPVEIVYTDGSCFENGTENARAGAGVWFGDGDDRTRAIRIPETMKNSNNTGELVGAKDGIENAHEFKELLINTDSKLVINGATKSLEKREDTNYLNVENEELWRAIIARLRERKTKTSFQWIKGHSGNYGNEKADKLAGEGARKEKAAAEDVDTDIPEVYKLTGAKLSKMSQASAYKMIRNAKHKEALGKSKQYRKETNRRKTIKNLERTRYMAIHLGNDLQSDERIWQSLRSKDLTQKTRQFLWKTMHEAHRVGPYWTSFRDEKYKARGECLECGQEEDMEHILTKCKAPGQAETWQYAKQLWNRKKAKWRKPDLATILASPMADFRNQKGKRRTGRSRFFKILMSECAFTIWKIRNNRVIPDEDGNFATAATKQEIQAKIRKALNERLDQDQRLTNTKKYGKNALKKKNVLATWSNVLEREDLLPDDWIGEAGVLVGRPKDVSGRSWLEEMEEETEI